jgi:hypothetical protein
MSFESNEVPFCIRQMPEGKCDQKIAKNETDPTCPHIKEPQACPEFQDINSDLYKGIAPLIIESYQKSKEDLENYKEQLKRSKETKK